MGESTTSSNFATKFSGIALAAITSATLASSPPICSKPTLIKDGVTVAVTASKGEHLPGEARSWEEVRRAQIRALRGKYKNYLTPSEEFARQKREEILLEG